MTPATSLEFPGHPEPAAAVRTLLGIGLNTNGTLRLAGRGAAAKNGTTVLDREYLVSHHALVRHRQRVELAGEGLSQWGQRHVRQLTTVEGRSDGTLAADGHVHAPTGVSSDAPASATGRSAAIRPRCPSGIDDLYVDSGTTLDDPGDIRVAAKRPVANGAVNQFTTQIGSGGSGYGSGHAPQVNERPLNTANGWSISTTTKATEDYNVEGRAAGDVDLSGATIVDYMGWINATEASTSNSPVTHIIVNGTATAKTLTTSYAMYTQFARSSIYPVRHRRRHRDGRPVHDDGASL